MQLFLNEDNIVYYFCSFEEELHNARNKKFNDWYKKHGNDSIAKLNATINEKDSDYKFYVSVLFNKSNRFSHEIMKDFYTTASEIDNDK